MSTNAQHTLGRYELIREVARSNDIVYEAWDPVTQRRVAVKVLNIPAGASDSQKADRKHRFEREARAAARLHHQNIVTLFDYGTQEEQDFLVFEFVDGPTLADLLLQRGPLSLDQARCYIDQLLLALAYAHAQGIVHRDVKPSNLFVCAGDKLKISDLGIARIESEASVTTDGQVFGTPAYMAPEQVRGLDVDRRVDVWAAGVVLYQMVTGAQPFKGGSVLEIGSCVLNEDPNMDLVQDATFRAVVAKALDKDPGQRFQTAREMLLGFEEPPPDLVASAVALTVAAPVSTFKPRWGASRTSLVWASTCIVAAAIGAGIVAVMGKASPTEIPRASSQPARIARAIPKDDQEVFEEAWEHSSLHDLMDSEEFRLLPEGAQSDRIDTWCRETIGKDYMGLNADQRRSVVDQLVDGVKAKQQLAQTSERAVAANGLPVTKPTNLAEELGRAVPAPIVIPPGQGETQPQGAEDPAREPPAANPPPSGTNPVAAQGVPTSQPRPAAASPAESAPANGPPTAYQYPDQQSHDLNDLEVLRGLHFVPYGPPRVEPGGTRVYTGPNGVVRIR